MRPHSLVMLLLLGSPSAALAQAQDNFPVCLRVYGPVGYDDCRYTSIAQCNASASGRSAQCLENPYFSATAVAPHAAARRGRQLR